jgi:hypothetical protein
MNSFLSGGGPSGGAGRHVAGSTVVCRRCYLDFRRRNRSGKG